MRFQNTSSRLYVRGFTLAEVMIGVAVLGLFILACFSGIVFNRVAAMKSKEEAIATDFLVHYSELIKALPFNNVANDFPINPLFNGSGGAPRIAIPVNSTPVALNTTNFETFHPDLIWLHNRAPQIQVTLTTTSVSGTPHDKHLNIRLTWDPPLGRGRRLQSQMDLVRTKDL
jgi:prepilin-type N-terminal cleavage/methylation domain-containing protein